MPIYEYRRPDGSTFEVIQGFREEPLTQDPDTGVPIERVLHAPAVHFKGKGFYNTDYGTRKRQRETTSTADGSSASTGESSSTDASSAPSEKSSSKGEKGSSKAESGSSSAGKGSQEGGSSSTAAKAEKVKTGSAG